MSDDKVREKQLRIMLHQYSTNKSRAKITGEIIMPLNSTEITNAKQFKAFI